MAKLILKDNQEKYVSYNTAAKIFQIQNGIPVKHESDEETAKLKKIAKQVISIDFKAIER